MLRAVFCRRSAWPVGGIAIVSAAVCLTFASIANCSTVVRLNMVTTDNQPGTSTIDIRLYDTATPLTVANFLNYVNNGRYNGTFIHRSVPGFVIQGGGYTYDAQTNTAPRIAT